MAWREEIVLSDLRDLAFAEIAQGVLVRNTVLPSGYVTPDTPLIVRGVKLVTPTKEDEERFNIGGRNGAEAP